MSIQGRSNGGQIKKLFGKYNKVAGLEVVDMGVTYNTEGDYARNPGAGNQIRNALAAINAHEGSEIFNADKATYWTNGFQLKEAMDKVQVLIDGGGVIIPPPVIDPLVWSGVVPNLTWFEDNSDSPWATFNLGDYVSNIDGTAIYILDSGILPAGITLISDGSFTGLSTELVHANGIMGFAVTDDRVEIVKSNVANWNVAPIV